MDGQRRNRLKELIVSQANSPTLILNDLLMGDEGAQILSDMLASYHSESLQNLEIKGNNISSLGFQILCHALMDCRNLKSITVEWNIIGLKNNGLNALCKLARNCLALQKIDLKNNRIDHLSVEPVCQIIRMNLRWLKHIDLRWNQIGQIGGRLIMQALQSNKNLKILHLSNNRISQPLMTAIDSYLLQQPLPQPVVNTQHQFPLSYDDYPSMAIQLHSAQLRNQIETQQKQAVLYREKMEIEINKVLQHIRNKGISLQQANLKYQSLANEEKTLKDQLREAQRMITSFKENTMKVGLELNTEHSEYKRGKYNMNRQSEELVKKLIDVNSQQVEEFNYDMSKKQEYLLSLLQTKMDNKKNSRERLVIEEEEYLNMKLERENVEYRVSARVSQREKKKYEEVFKQVQERVAENEGIVNAMKRKNQYLNSELTQAIIKGLERIRKLEAQISDYQHRLKKLHDEMTKTNLEMDTKHTKLEMLTAEQLEKQNAISFRRNQVNNLISEGNILLDLVRHQQAEERKTTEQSSEFVHRRMLDLERTIRTQQSNNNMLKNQYQKLCSFLQSHTKNAIFASIFPIR